MADFFFPLLFLEPGFEGDAIECDGLTISRRKWNTNSFDFPSTDMEDEDCGMPPGWQVLLSRCNLELRVEAEDVEAAKSQVRSIRLGMYAAGVSPFLAPVITSHSINAYSGINTRDSESRRDQLADGLKEGWTTKQGKISAWPWEVSFSCLCLPERLKLTSGIFLTGCRLGIEWAGIQATSKSLQVAEDAAGAAPRLSNRDQSLLHVWSALEALFPSVSQEVSFRLALYLAQLIGPPAERRGVFRKVKDAYNLRSKVAHGSKQGITLEQWEESWGLPMEAVKAVVSRGAMPSEDDLMNELLGA